MRTKNMMGIIFSNTNDEALSELTSVRAIGSVPFGCRYRLIDFTLSSLVNAGITKVGVVTKRNYQSLMDHIGAGRPWDLARKTGGICILPPYGYGENAVYRGKIDALNGNLSYLDRSTEEYVLLSDANIVANIPVEAMITAHLSSGADITMAYKRGITGSLYLDINEENRVTAVSAHTARPGQNASLNLILMRRDLLISLVKTAHQHNYTDFGVDILQREAAHYLIRAYEVTEHATVIDNMQRYFTANMDLLQRNVRNALFLPTRPILTKLRDDMPTRYGFSAHVADSLIADGCIIEGEVHNSIIFRGVTVAKGAKVQNCILAQSTHVGQNADLDYVVSDKNVEIQPGRKLSGAPTFPFVIGKGLTV